MNESDKETTSLVYEAILAKIDQFEPLITDLSELLQELDDDGKRKEFRRALGNAMGALEGEIALPIRLHLGKAK